MKQLKVEALVFIAQLWTLISVNCKDDKPLTASVATDNIKDEDLKTQKFPKAAVSCDISLCATVGKKILKKGGSAVDGAIATLLCLGTVQFGFSGLGGGGFMLVYKRDEKKTYGFDYRETAPAGIDKSLFEDDENKKKRGGLAVAVPGEVRGFRTAWKKFGKLEWKELVQPSIDIARDGFNVSQGPTDASKGAILKTDEVIRKLELKQEEPDVIFKSFIKRPIFVETLRKVRDDPESFYTGDIAKTIVEDLKSKGGIMKLDDMKDYKVKTREPLKMKLKDLTLHTMPLPTGGPILMHILGICEEFNFTKDDLSTKDKIVLTFHRVIEAFKFANAYRPHFGDPEFATKKEEFEENLKGILDKEMMKKHFKMIDDKMTHEKTYYSKSLTAKNDRGTTHISIIAENGDAVSATSSLNDKYGAQFGSEKLGILYNNQLRDAFIASSDERKFSWSEENSPKPGSRTLSGMAPNIIIDDNGDVKMVTGAAGGVQIPPSVSWVIMMKLWFGMDLGNAVLMTRPPQVLFPDYVSLEDIYPMKLFLQDELKKKKHTINDDGKHTIVSALYRDSKDSEIEAKGDPRKKTATKGDGY